MIGIGDYNSNIHYFIPGKIYKVKKETTDSITMITLINELGKDHIMPFDIFKVHFKPLSSNKRKRHECKTREML